MDIDTSMKNAFHAAGKSIVLIGFMGVGKTAVGTALKDILEVDLVDSDVIIEKEAGKSIARIFAEDGEEAFRKLEQKTILNILSNGAPVILSTGGGAFLNDDVRAIILKNSTSVWLQASKETIFERTETDLNQYGIKRPKIHVVEGTQTPTTLEQRKEIIASLLEERSSIYAECAYSVDTEAGNAEENAKSLLNKLYNLPRPQ